MAAEPPDLIQKVPAEWRRRWGEVEDLAPGKGKNRSSEIESRQHDLFKRGKTSEDTATRIGLPESFNRQTQ
jgi:hypothetical protein